MLRPRYAESWLEYGVLHGRPALWQVAQPHGLFEVRSGVLRKPAADRCGAERAGGGQLGGVSSAWLEGLHTGRDWSLVCATGIGSASGWIRLYGSREEGHRPSYWVRRGCENTWCINWR